MKPRKKIISEEIWPQLPDIYPTVFACAAFSCFLQENLPEWEDISWSERDKIDAKLDGLPLPAQEVIRAFLDLIEYLTVIDHKFMRPGDEISSGAEKLEKIDIDYFNVGNAENLLYITIIAYSKRYAPKLAKETYSFWVKHGNSAAMKKDFADVFSRGLDVLPDSLMIIILVLQMALVAFEEGTTLEWMINAIENLNE